MKPLTLHIHYPNGNVGRYPLNDGDELPLNLIEGASMVTIEIKK